MPEVPLLSQLTPHPTAGAAATTIDFVVSTATEPPCRSVSRTPDALEPGRSVEDARFLTRALLCDGYANDDDRAHLEAGTDEHVDVWTPAVHATSRFELMSVLTNVDDAISDVQVAFTELVGTPSTALVTWLATGRFSRPAFLGDDHLLEPNGVVVRVAGATSVSFTDSHRAVQIRCFYDRLSLIGQMLSPRAIHVCA